MTTTYGPIQIQPPGLLGVLQLKNSGQNPSQLSDTYQPIFEMRDWLLLARAEVLQEGFAAVAGGVLFTPSVGTFVVPDRETWFVHRIQAAAATSAAADVVQGLHAAYRLPVGVSVAIIGVTPPSDFTAAGGAVLTNYFSNGGGFFAPAGAVFGITMNKNAAAPATASLSALITRLPI